MLPLVSLAEMRYSLDGTGVPTEKGMLSVMSNLVLSAYTSIERSYRKDLVSSDNRQVQRL